MAGKRALESPRAVGIGEGVGPGRGDAAAVAEDVSGAVERHPAELSPRAVATGGGEGWKRATQLASEVRTLRASLDRAEAARKSLAASAEHEKAREVLQVRQKCRALLVARDGELRRAQEQLASLQRGAVSENSASQLPQSQTVGWEGGLGGGHAMETEQDVLATARQQGAISAELERWKLRATSLEARMRGATEARRAWAMREAELLEQLEELDRLIKAQVTAQW